MQVINQPGLLDWELTRGTSAALVLTYSELDLSIFSIHGVIEMSCDPTEHINVPINIIDALAGVFEIDFKSEFTANLGIKGKTQIFKYHISITSPEGDTIDLIRDVLVVSG